MKKGTSIIFFLWILIGVHAQNVVYEQKHDKWAFVRETAVSAGIGIGGNSIFGAEMQLMFVPRWSVQLGAGVNGFSGGINYHIYPTVSSPYFSAQIWQQGFGTNYKAAYAGSMFVYRANKLLQAGLGVGYRIQEIPDIQSDTKFVLMFNLGIYLPM